MNVTPDIYQVVQRKFVNCSFDNALENVHFNGYGDFFHPEKPTDIAICYVTTLPPYVYTPQQKDMNADSVASAFYITRVRSIQLITL